VLVDEDVVGLEIAMNDALGVQIDHRLAQLRGDREAQFPRHVAIALEQRRDVARRQIFGHNVDVGTVFTDTQKLQNKRMTHCAGAGVCKQ
jgi:hypothetical protein